MHCSKSLKSVIKNRSQIKTRQLNYGSYQHSYCILLTFLTYPRPFLNINLHIKKKHLYYLLFLSVQLYIYSLNLSKRFFNQHILDLFLTTHMPSLIVNLLPQSD